MRPRSAQRLADIKTFMRQTECDIIGFAEHNTNMKHCKGMRNPSELFRTENSLRHSFAHNKHEDPGVFQQGGVALLAVSGAASRVFQQGVDESGLGRWAWLLFRGRNGLCTRIYVAYRPTRSSGNGTVYQQQLR